MKLSFGGKNNQWTSSNFVLLDGQMVDYQHNTSFFSDPSVNFKWLVDKYIPVNLGRKTTSSGIFVFNADSEVELYFNCAEIPGLNNSSMAQLSLNLIFFRHN